MLIDIPSTAIDIYRMLPEGTRCEVIFNVLTMSPSPALEHQVIASNIHGALFQFLQQVKIGKALFAPVDVYFEGNLSVVQPDILVLLNQNLSCMKPNGVFGPPDLIIEILSPGNRPHDTRTKKSLYEKAGVKEYFIVDPATKEVHLFALGIDGLYTEVYRQQNIVKSALLGCELNF